MQKQLQHQICLKNIANIRRMLDSKKNINNNNNNKAQMNPIP